MSAGAKRKKPPSGPPSVPGFEPLHVDVAALEPAFANGRTSHTTKAPKAVAEAQRAPGLPRTCRHLHAVLFDAAAVTDAAPLEAGSVKLPSVSAEQAGDAVAAMLWVRAEVPLL